MSNWFKAIISIGISFFAGFIGSLATAPAIPTWYQTLNKPGWNPPNWLFAPVWSALYIMMGLSLFLIWKQPSSSRPHHMFYILYPIQLALNVLWSIFFFGFKNPFAALIDIIILWIAIFMTLKVAFDIDKRAAYLLMPYLAWVTFAATLNFAIVLLN